MQELEPKSGGFPRLPGGRAPALMDLPAQASEVEIEAAAEDDDLTGHGAAVRSSHSSGDATMTSVNHFSGADKEVRFDQPFLIYGAKKFKSAIARNPKDHDEVYRWALALQESASNYGPDSSSSKDVLLQEACKKYEEATKLCATHYNAYVQWADAVFERARMRGRAKEAEEFWKQAANKYEKAVQLNWNSPQALNNWGLALQELSEIVPLREKENIVRAAINKYRAAFRLEFDFCGAIYNLGTILVYLSALRLVRSTLPIPYFKVGYLTAPPANNSLAPHKDWESSLFVLNHERLQQAEKHSSGSPSGRLQESAQMDRSSVKIDVPDIISVSACADLTLPQGAGLIVHTSHHPMFLVADTYESLDGWLDAIRLVYTIFAQGKSDVLASIISR